MFHSLGSSGSYGIGAGQTMPLAGPKLSPRRSLKGNQMKMKVLTHIVSSAAALLACGITHAQTNTGYGTQALNAGPSGQNNAAFGYQALYFDTTGANNVG